MADSNTRKRAYFKATLHLSSDRLFEAKSSTVSTRNSYYQSCGWQWRWHPTRHWALIQIPIHQGDPGVQSDQIKAAKSRGKRSPASRRCPVIHAHIPADSYYIPTKRCQRLSAIECIYKSLIQTPPSTAWENSLRVQWQPMENATSKTIYGWIPTWIVCIPIHFAIRIIWLPIPGLSIM